MRINKIASMAADRGIKLNYIAKACGVTIQTVSRWSQNKTQPNILQGEIIAEILGVKIEELIGDSENEELD